MNKNYQIHSIVLICLFLIHFSCDDTSLNNGHMNLFFEGRPHKKFILPDHVYKAINISEEVDVTIQIDSNTRINKISNYISGINATTYTGDYLTDDKLLAFTQALEPGIIRFPGGDASNMYFFNGLPNDLPEEALTYNGSWTDFTDGTLNVNWRMNTEKYYAFLEMVDSEGFITINYPYARYGTSEDPVAKAASLAASWVRYDQGRTRFWEIGNETYACWEGGFRIDTTQNQDNQPEYINGKLYGQHFKVFADSMRAAAKKLGFPIYIGAVFADSDDIWDGSGRNITRSWNDLLAPELRREDGRNYADFITVHSYFLNKGESTPVEIINTCAHPHELQDYVYDKLDHADVAHVPLALTEWNIKEPHQTTQVGGVHAVATLCELNHTGFVAATYFALKDYWREQNGDFGMFSHHDPDMENSEPYPSFYHFYYFNKVIGEQMVHTETNDATHSIACYASSYKNNELGIILINKSQISKTFLLKFSNDRTKRKFYWYEIDKFDDGNTWSEKININGISDSDGSKGGPSDNFQQIPAWSNEIENGVRLNINGLSAIYLLIE